jgi:hypothetical protein
MNLVRLVALVKSLLGTGGTTDFLVRPWGIRRTRKSLNREFDGLGSPSYHEINSPVSEGQCSNPSLTGFGL